jgi:hypothetical protein
VTGQVSGGSWMVAESARYECSGLAANGQGWYHIQIFEFEIRLPSDCNMKIKSQIALFGFDR